VTRFFGVMGSLDSSRLTSARHLASGLPAPADPHAPSIQLQTATAVGAAVSATRPVRGGTFGAVSVLCIGHLRDRSGATLEASALAQRFEQQGASLLDDLTGDFALALFDQTRSRGLVATDRMGVQPVFYRCVPQGIAFGSSPTDVLGVLGEAPQLAPQAIFDYLFGHVVPAPNAIYQGVSRLLPGSAVEITNGATTVRCYWSAKFQEQDRFEFGEAKRKFFDSLKSGISSSIEGANCGAFLSGGTDSSTIAGLLTQVAGQPAKTFSIGFAASGFDEMEYARLASKHFGTVHHEYYVTPRDIVEATPKLAAIHPQPFGNSSALPTYFCARLAREHGIDRLLGGDGGDELFGGNARYAKQRVFSHYDRLPEVLRKSLLEPLSGALSRRGRLPGIGKLVSYVEQARIPMPARLETYNLLHRLGFADVLEPDLLAQVDTEEPLRLNSDAYHNPSAQSIINRMLALDFKTTLADSDIPKVMNSCELAGADVVFPMLHSNVVDFSLGLPPEMKLKGTQLRYFFKEALSDFLPPAIITKSKHGFGLPFGQWALDDQALRELSFDTLVSFKRRNIVRPAFIDKLRDELLPEHPNYYGTMVWILMSLELWLQAHIDRGPATSDANASHV